MILLTRVTIVFLLAAAATAAHQIAPPASRPQPKILRSKSATIRVQLFDARSGAAIASTNVVVTSDNGIRCVTVPCPTNSQRWTGKTDARGTVVVPTKMLQANTTIQTATHALASLIDDAEERNGIWVIELVPKSPGPGRSVS